MNVTAIPGALQIATSAIQRSQSSLNKDAAVVANANGNPESVLSADTIGALVDSRQQVLYTAAAVKIINASDDMIQSLLDVHA